MLRSIIRYAPRLIAAALALALLGVVLAQSAPPEGLPEPTFDPRVWAASAAGLAAFVFAVVAFVKEHVITSLRGWGTIAASFGLAIATAVVLSLTGDLDATIGEAAIYGMTAGFIASGGWDGIKGAVRKGASEATEKTVPEITPDLPPSRRR